MVDGRLFNLPLLIFFRKGVYKLLFNIGKNVHIENGVFIDREHRKLNSSIIIMDNVLISRHVHIDYTGFLTIKNNVRIAQGVTILTHHRDLDELVKGNDVNIQTQLVIEENAYIGLNAIILSSCNYIGKNSRVGAGAVVTKDVPDNVLVAGVPAKVLNQL